MSTRSFILIACCLMSAVSAHSHKKSNDSHTLSSEEIRAGKKIRAKSVHLNLREGTTCQHVAKYNNGSITTQVGSMKGLGETLGFDVAGEQTVVMYDGAGQTSFSSVSKNWEIRDGYVAHHHNGFDVLTKKNKQIVILD